MTRPCPSHPRLRHPITVAQFRREFQHIYRRVPAHLRHNTVRLEFLQALSLTHRRNCRRYAQVIWNAGLAVFQFAPEVLWLPRQHRRGLFAHEIGHTLAGHEASELEADGAAWDVLHILIGYDERWPGKGLQVAR